MRLILAIAPQRPADRYVVERSRLLLKFEVIDTVRGKAIATFADGAQAHQEAAEMNKAAMRRQLGLGS